MLSPAVLLLLLAAPDLKREIAKIAADAHGKVSVACDVVDCDFNPHAHPPMQSVFKFPLGLTVLHAVEAGRFSLDQPIRFLAGDRILPKTYSPLQDKYPAAGVDVPLRELIRLTVSLSDNAASEVLLRIVGGPREVQDYISSLGIAGFHLEDGEAAMHRDEQVQYRNWLEPAAAVKLLRLLIEKPPLTPEHMKVLLGFMRDSPTGLRRIKGQLPPGTAVTHKTGTSGVDHGLARATNDLGLVELPDGRSFAIAVFVTDSTADEAAREAVIARIAKAAYEAVVSSRRR